MAGQFNTVGNFVARGADKVDPTLVDILSKAAEATGLTVEAYSGYRPGDKRQHGHGNAVDIRIIGPDGKPLDNYQTPETFPIYETFAQAARQVQQEEYPELGKQFRWGGYFSGKKGKYGAMDLMHFDVGGSDNLGMAGGSWDKGLTDQQKAYFPGVESVGALAFNGDVPQGNRGAQALTAFAGGGQMPSAPQAQPSNQLIAQNVPAPFSNQPANFQSLFPQTELAPANLAPQREEKEDEDYSGLIKSFGLDTTAPAQQQDNSALVQQFGLDGGSGAPASGNDGQYGDLIQQFGLDAAPAAKMAEAVKETPGSSLAGVQDTVKSIGSGLTRGAAELVGFPGTIYEAAAKGTNWLTGSDFPENHPASGRAFRGYIDAATGGAASYEPKTTVGKYAGTASEFIPSAIAAPGNALMNAVRFGLVPGVASEAAGQSTEGTALEPWARVGAAIASPFALEGGLRAASKGANMLSGATPRGAARNNLTEALRASGKAADDVAAEMATNPRLAPMDVDPNLQQMSMNLANQGGAPRSILYDAAQARSAGAKDAVTGAFDDAAGTAPDTVKILNDLRARESAAVLKPEQVRRSLDDALGPAADPKGALDAMVTQRSQAARPLYEKALSNKVAWDDRLQQFLDDPVVGTALNRGARIQRLESLADDVPFRPEDYAIKEFNAAGDPIISGTPNMRTLNVIKKGLDDMVESARDPVTGRLSEEGVAVNKVRSSFLKKLDSVNPDYAAAREAWAGPSKVMEAYDKGLSIFSTGTGKKSLENTPAQLEKWVKSASPDEIQALKYGARSSLEQSMANTSGQVDRVAKLASIEANQKKLSILMGEKEANKIIASLKAEYADPVGDAFERGLGILRNRTGASGLEDRPEFWREWFSGASDAEKEAVRQGARVAMDTQINAVRSAAAKGAAIPEVGMNRARLEIILGKSETDKLSKILADEQRIAQTNAKLFAGAQTAPRQAVNKLTEVTTVTPSYTVGPTAIGALTGGTAGAITGATMSAAKIAGQWGLRQHNLARNELMARAMSGDTRAFVDALQEGAAAKTANRLMMGSRPMLKSGGLVPVPAAGNLLTNGQSLEGQRR